MALQLAHDSRGCLVIQVGRLGVISRFEGVTVVFSFVAIVLVWHESPLCRIEPEKEDHTISQTNHRQRSEVSWEHESTSFCMSDFHHPTATRCTCDKRVCCPGHLTLFRFARPFMKCVNLDTNSYRPKCAIRRRGRTSSKNDDPAISFCVPQRQRLATSPSVSVTPFCPGPFPAEIVPAAAKYTVRIPVAEPASEALGDTVGRRRRPGHCIIFRVSRSDRSRA